MKYKIFDAHCDTALKIWFEGKSLLQNDCMVSAEKCKNYESASFVTAIFNEGNLKTKDIFDIAAKIKEETEKCKDKNFSTVVSVEGLGNTEDLQISDIEKLAGCGIRIASLTWNGDNPLCGGIKENSSGITALGKKYLEELKKHNIILDTSHISDKGFYEALEYFDGPVCATHSNSRAVCSHNRNLTDGMFLKICERNGFCGINLCPDFLNSSGKATVDDVIRHIEHFLNLGGENVLGIGADFDGIDSVPSDIQSCEDLYVLFDKMLSLNYSEDIINKISHQNLEKMLNLQ